MPNRFFAQFALPLIFTALLLSPPAQAKTATWYRVEMLVFSRPAGSEAEQWNPTPDLAYPDESRMLTRVATAPESQKRRIKRGAPSDAPHYSSKEPTGV